MGAEAMAFEGCHRTLHCETGHDPVLETISAFVVTRAGDAYKLLELRDTHAR